MRKFVLAPVVHGDVNDVTLSCSEFWAVNCLQILCWEIGRSEVREKFIPQAGIPEGQPPMYAGAYRSRNKL